MIDLALIRPCISFFLKTCYVRRFVRTEITPYAAEWDEAEPFPPKLYKKAAAIGMLGLGFPEEYGGTGGDVLLRIGLSEALSPCGAGGICAVRASSASTAN